MGLPAVVSRESPGRLGPYELVEQLGQGGMAIVYRARGPGATRDIVLKAMLPNLVHSRPLVAMFEEEARLTGELSHTNIVRVEDYGVAAGIPYLTMEYLDGRNLSQIRVALNKLKRRVPIGVAVAIGRGLCRGLGFAHQFVNSRGQRLQIIHRDVSPSNVMLQRDGSVKLLDFGVAKLSNAAGQAVTSSLKGKFAYMAPEQVNQEPIDRRCDVFAAGIVLHELLTGKRLFGAKSERETLRRVALAEAAPPSQLNPEVPPELDELILRALRREADGRYDSGNEMAAALEQLGLAAEPEELAAFVGELFPANDADAAEREGDTEVSGRVFDDNVALDGRTAPERGVSAPHLVLLPNDEAILDEMLDEGQSITGREIRLEAEPAGLFSLAGVSTVMAPIEEIRPTGIYSPSTPALAELRAKDARDAAQFDAAPTRVGGESEPNAVLPMVMVDLSDTARARAVPAPSTGASPSARGGVLENLFDADIVFANPPTELAVRSVPVQPTEAVDVNAVPVFKERAPRPTWLFLLGGILGVAFVCVVTIKLHAVSPAPPAAPRAATPTHDELSGPPMPEPSLPAAPTPAPQAAPADAPTSLVGLEDVQPPTKPKPVSPVAKPAAPPVGASTSSKPAGSSRGETKPHARTTHPRPTLKEGGIVDPFDSAE
jgi:serine/threonine protein kinase